MQQRTNITNYVYSGSSPIRGSGVGVDAKRYEISNHLGNVLTTFTDRKKEIVNGTSVTAYSTFIASSQDYYPFGMQMPNRGFNANVGNYRFGFNGKENDNEVKGNGNQQDYGFRIYDPRIGKFLSVDPLTKSYPWYTPYQFSGNCPIWCIDLDGLEPVPRNYSYQDRKDLFGDIDETFVTDPVWTGINSAYQVNYVSKVGESWVCKKVCSGASSMPIKTLIKDGSRWSTNVTIPTSYIIDFNANQDVPVDDNLTKKTYVKIAAAIQKNSNQVIQIQGNSNLPASGQLTTGNINGTEITTDNPQKVSDLTNARAQTIRQGLINVGVPESNIEIVPGSYGNNSTKNTTLTVQERNDINMPVKWEELKYE